MQIRTETFTHVSVGALPAIIQRAMNNAPSPSNVASSPDVDGNFTIVITYPGVSSGSGAGSVAGPQGTSNLNTDSVPSQLAVLRDVTGTHWASGEGPNAIIADWLTFIASQYGDMSHYCNAVIHEQYFEWCGLAIAYAMSKAGLRPVFGNKDTDDFLWAVAWLNWGQTVQTPQRGDVIVFDFGGGRQHVSLFENDSGGGYWVCRGGNQSNEVKTSKFPRSSVIGIRRAS